ncbi:MULTISPECIES: GNAT family N-acetyltransferase [unclassified Acidovorax]|uniref:GNAT family N-acetyltransferase n=1 Tax=unclassified Acidovorax TaxID=2684926 RepID=UPI0009EA2E05|nr:MULTISPECIES: GNAT family N-acetyltransferase [unclassified Acidovorax]
MHTHPTSSSLPPLPEPSPVCDALATALMDDPFYQAVTVDSAHDPALRHRVLAQYFALAMDEANAVGEVMVSGDDGAALWATSRATASEKAVHSARRTEGLARCLGPMGFDNYQRIGAAMEAQVPDPLHAAWYLSILGVRPAARGRGVAQRLVAQTLARADVAGATCYLETFNPLSLAFYRRLGFVREVPCVEPVSGRAYWLMVREARPPRA